MTLKTLIQLFENETSFFSVNNVSDVDEFQKLSIRLPANAIYDVNLSELDNISILAVKSEFLTGTSSGNPSRFVVTYQNPNFISSQNIDCFGFVLINFDESPTALQISNPSNTDEIRINLFLGSE